MRPPLVSLLIALLATLVPTLPAAAQAPAAPARTFRELGYGDLSARSMHGSLSYFFPLPPGQVPREGAQLELVLSHSTLLVPDRSTLTVAANGQSVRSVFLNGENANRGRLVVPLPTQGFRGSGYFVQIQLFQRLTRDECEETQNPALWTTVHADSTLLLPAGPGPEGPRLSELAGAFAPPPLAEPNASPTPLAIVVPREPSPEELDAAGLAAFQVGRWAASVGRAPVVQARRDVPQQGAAVLVGGGASLAPPAVGAVSWNGQAFATAGGAVPADHGVLAASAAPAPRLLVSGGSPAAVREAAEALVRPERRAALTADHALVSGNAIVERPAPPWRDGAASFAQLGIDRRQVAGPGEHQVDLFVDRPPGWVLQAGAYVDLVLESAPAARPETSWVALSVAGQEVGSQRLDRGTPDLAGGARSYRFALPHDRLNNDLAGRPLRQIPMQARLYLDLPQNGCTPAAPQAAWAAVLPTSAVYLPHEQAGGLDLGRFPAPMLERGPGRLAVVVPDAPTDAELSAGLEVAAAIGRWASADPERLPRLVAVSSLPDVDRNTLDLVVVGSPERNALARDAAGRATGLFQLFSPPIYRLTPGERRGQLQIAPSPWNRDRALLAVTGDEPGLLAAAGALASVETRSLLSGRAASVVAELPPQTLTGADPAGQPALAFAPRLEQPLLPRIPTWQIVGAVVLVAFLALVLVLVTVRWLRRA